MRRLPVYFLVDCSDSMVGEPIEAVQEGFRQLVRELRKDPHALETVHLSVIAFSSEARQLVPLTELMEVQPPRFPLGPGTALGKAVRLLRARIDEEVRPTTPDRKGDYLPLVFLLTDGLATDEPEAIQQALEAGGRTRIGSLYGIGCGEDADLAGLSSWCDAVFRLDEMSETQLRSLFMWLTASVRTASVSVAQGGVDLSKPPEGIAPVGPGLARPAPASPRVVVLHAVCSETRGHYLIRYIRSGPAGPYRPLSVHPLEAPRPSRADVGFAAMSSRQIAGIAPCGHCGNPGGGVCGACGTLFCLPERGPDVATCPNCQAIMQWSSSGREFDIGGRSD